MGAGEPQGCCRDAALILLPPLFEATVLEGSRGVVSGAIGEVALSTIPAVVLVVILAKFPGR